MPGWARVGVTTEDWQNGQINWLLDVIAPDRKTTGRVIANFGSVVKGSDLRLHPMVAGLVDEEMRGRMQSSTARKVEL